MSLKSTCLVRCMIYRLFLYVDDDILKGMGHESSLFELTKQ